MKKKVISLPLFLLLLLSLPAWEARAQETGSGQKKFSYSFTLQGGMMAASPISVNGEFVTMHGFSINQQHLISLATGIGGGHYEARSNDTKQDIWSDPFYVPIFLNYRYIIRPEKKFSPMVSVSLGGLLDFQSGFSLDELSGGGFYGDFSAGFKAGKFFLLGGFGLLSMNTLCSTYPEDWNYHYIWDKPVLTSNRWITPMGISLKVGLTF